MPEEVVTTQAAAAPVAPMVDPAIKQELDHQMAISLNGGVLPANTSVEPATAPVVVVDGAAATTTVDPFGIFKEKFGYETPEAAVQEIESLRALRATPPVLKFENETSKAVAEALQAGKFQEVYEVLDQQMKIDRLAAAELTVDSAAEIVKLGMQLKYKELTPAEIAHKFNKQYALPLKPALLPAEDQDEYNERVKLWQAQVDERHMDLMIDAKLSKPELLATKSKLVFPTINRSEDVEFQEWQKTVQENDKLSIETTQAYKAFTPKSLETKINFVDKENKIDFDFIYEPDPESFGKAVEMVADINEFWKSFINPDGTPNRKEFLEAIYFGMNRTSIIKQALNQAKNATIKASLPDNTTGGLVRQLPQTQEPNELDALMRASLKGYGGF